MSIRLVYFLIVAYDIEALQLTPSPNQPTLGDEFSLTCTSSLNAINFGVDTRTVCIVTRVNSNGSCITFSCNTSFNYTCNATTYTMAIPGSFNIDVYHGTIWRCQDIAGGQNPSNQVVLNVRGRLYI